MKKNIGTALALYPMPVTIVGAIAGDDPTWTLVAHVYETPGFETFICIIDATYVDEENLDERGKIDYAKVKPVLFEFPTYQYLATGDVLGPCLSFKK